MKVRTRPGESHGRERAGGSRTRSGRGREGGGGGGIHLKRTTGYLRATSLGSSVPRSGLPCTEVLGVREDTHPTGRSSVFAQNAFWVSASSGEGTTQHV